MKKPKNRISIDKDGVDEVFVHRPKAIHLERMSKGLVWGCIDLENGSSIELEFYTPSKSCLKWRAEEEKGVR